MSGARLSALLCSRLCHDLVSPVGAINNGLEILADEQDPGMRDQAVDLMAHSAREAARRLSFFRFAFGAGGGMGDMIPMSDARDAAQGMFAVGRIKMDWPGAGGELPKQALKMLMNLILIAAGALPRGGQIQVEASASGGAVRLQVKALGDGANLKPEINAALQQDMDEASLDTHTVVAQLVHILASEIGAKIETAADPDGVRIGVQA